MGLPAQLAGVRHWREIAADSSHLPGTSKPARSQEQRSLTVRQIASRVEGGGHAGQLKASAACKLRARSPFETGAADRLKGTAYRSSRTLAFSARPDDFGCTSGVRSGGASAAATVESVHVPLSSLDHRLALTETSRETARRKTCRRAREDAPPQVAAEKNRVRVDGVPAVVTASRASSANPNRRNERLNAARTAADAELRLDRRATISPDRTLRRRTLR